MKEKKIDKNTNIRKLKQRKNKSMKYLTSISSLIPALQLTSHN